MGKKAAAPATPLALPMWHFNNAVIIGYAHRNRRCLLQLQLRMLNSCIIFLCFCEHDRRTLSSSKFLKSPCDKHRVWPRYTSPSKLNFSSFRASPFLLSNTTPLFVSTADLQNICSRNTFHRAAGIHRTAFCRLSDHSASDVTLTQPNHNTEHHLASR